jgi:hypothetical protein
MFLIDQRRALSQSPIWDLQKAYFAERSVEAWR